MYVNDIYIEQEAEELMDWILETLPDQWKLEFIEDIMVGPSYDYRTLNKVFMYYCEDILEEIPIETYNQIAEKYIMIEL